jgi:hypothetical protein
VFVQHTRQRSLDLSIVDPDDLKDDDLVCSRADDAIRAHTSE